MLGRVDSTFWGPLRSTKLSFVSLAEKHFYPIHYTDSNPCLADLNQDGVLVI